MTASYTKGIWFGPRPEAARRDEVLEIRRNGATEIERAEAALELFKLGDFSSKTDILDAMQVVDIERRNGLCCVYCSVATHGEISALLDVLDENDEEDMGTFATFSYLTLSLQAIPVLLRLAEVWEGTELEEGLIDACRILYPVYTDQESRLAELGTFYRRLVDKVRTDEYYYCGVPAFAGDLTKELMQGAAQARLEGHELRMSMIPTLLSVWSGLECPVRYTSIIDEPAIGSILEYVKVITSMKGRWVAGGKFFYGHRVD